MGQIDWLQMLAYQQELYHLSRALLTQGQNQHLTASERELLARLYLEPDSHTPLALSRSSGMKKEAVSRTLRGLLEKGCICKDRDQQDERSYILSLTDAGRAALRQEFSIMLQPLYELRHQMGQDFDRLFHLIQSANRQTR